MTDPLVCLVVNLVNASPSAGWTGTLDQLREEAEAQESEIVEDGVALGRKLARLSPALRSRAGIIHTARLANGKRLHHFKRSQICLKV